MSTHDPDATSQNANISDFVKKIYRMLDDQVYNHIVSWGENGTSFVVKDQNEFSREILPKHFKHCNFASFVRQLNKYDFHKVKNSEDTKVSGDQQVWEFQHPKFQRGRPEWLDEIKRKSSSGRKPDQIASSGYGYSYSGPNQSNDTKASPVAVDLSYLSSRVESIANLQHQLMRMIHQTNQHVHMLRSELTVCKNHQRIVETYLGQLQTALKKVGAYTSMDIHEELRANAANAGLMPPTETDFMGQRPDPRFAEAGPGSSSGNGIDNIVNSINSFSGQVEASAESFQGISRSVSHAYHEAKSLVSSDGPQMQPPPHMGIPPSHAHLPPLPIVSYRPHYLTYGVVDPHAGFPGSSFAPSGGGGGGPGGGGVSQTPYNAPPCPSTPAQAEQIRHMWRIPPRVLVVDDDQVCRVLSIKMLSQLGCQLDYAVDGKDAVRKALSKPRYDLIFMDIFMPNKDGFEAAAEIRRHDSQTPIISMTSMNQIRLEDLTRAGMNAYLPKPLSIQNLLKLLWEFLGKRLSGDNPNMGPTASMEKSPRSLSKDKDGEGALDSELATEGRVKRARIEEVSTSS